MAYGKGNSPTAGVSLRVDTGTHPGWRSGRDVVPRVGDRVYCTEGLAEVVRVAGKTGDGSRLLELRLSDPKARPFFAAASNVLIDPGT